MPRNNLEGMLDYIRRYNTLTNTTATPEIHTTYAPQTGIRIDGWREVRNEAPLRWRDEIHPVNLKTFMIQSWT